jgi:hypothetical protein
MQNIKIENSWESDDVKKECKYCDLNLSLKSATYIEYETKNISSETDYDKYSVSGLFTYNLTVIKYPNLIITKTNESNITNINIFDTIKNKIIFSSKNIIDEGCDKFRYNSSMMMDNFIIMKFSHKPTHLHSIINYGYIIYNFETRKHSLLVYYDLCINNDKSIFVFLYKGRQDYSVNTIQKKSKIQIVTKSNIDNIIEIQTNIDNNSLRLNCICNNNVLVFNSYSTGQQNYYDINKKEIVYTSKNKFIGWRENRFIEYDRDFKKCNLISFISNDIKQILIKNNTPKKIINCIRCLDKFEEFEEEIIPEHKNICSLCIIKL